MSIELSGTVNINQMVYSCRFLIYEAYMQPNKSMAAVLKLSRMYDVLILCYTISTEEVRL